jgi:hypothetical protein
MPRLRFVTITSYQVREGHVLGQFGQNCGGSGLELRPESVWLHHVLPLPSCTRPQGLGTARDGEDSASRVVQ